MNEQKVVNKYEYKIPSWAMPFLINGDSSGLNLEDYETIRNFELVVLAKHGSGHWSFESEESYFSHNNDVTDLGSDIYDCVYVTIEEVTKEENLVTGTWLPVFPGFYGTIFDDDSIVDSEIEYIEEQVKPEELAACMIKNMYHSNAITMFYKEYQDSIAKQCVSIIWNNLRNLHYVENIEFEEISSPKFYNFINDSINVKVTFSPENIRNIKNLIDKNPEEWKKYLKENYSSYDGFMSHHSNRAESEEWNIETALADRHNAGAVLQFICDNENITDETLYYNCENNVQLNIDMLKKECIKNGWYVPKNICLDWFRSLAPRFKKNYKFKRVSSLAFFAKQYILETPRQRYIFVISKEEIINNHFIIKRFFKIFIFAKLKEEKKR